MDNLITEKKIKHIATKYLCIFHNFYSNPTSNSLYSHFNITFLAKVEVAFSSLSSPLKLIINNDFFYQAYPGWWRNKYSKKKYKRLKTQAMNMFLEVFYENDN